MTIKDIQLLLDAEVLSCEEKLSKNVSSAFGSDLMSDVLAFVQERTVLITGLINVHVFRTAQMIDVACIVFSRGKRPNEELLAIGRDMNIVMLSTEYTTYEVCGILYANGLPGINNGI